MKTATKQWKEAEIDNQMSIVMRKFKERGTDIEDYYGSKAELLRDVKSALKGSKSLTGGTIRNKKHMYTFMNDHLWNAVQQGDL